MDKGSKLALMNVWLQTACITTSYIKLLNALEALYHFMNTLLKAKTNRKLSNYLTNNLLKNVVWSITLWGTNHINITVISTPTLLYNASLSTVCVLQCFNVYGVQSTVKVAWRLSKGYHNIRIPADVANFSSCDYLIWLSLSVKF